MKTIYFNEDNHAFYLHPAERMTEDGVASLVDEYAKSKNVKGILFCTNVQRALFDSNVWERFRDIDDDDLLMKNLWLLSECGIDQFKIWLERSKEVDIEGWLSMRMNDSHGLKEASLDMDHWHSKWPSQFWRNNRQLRRAPYRLERSWEGSFNYGLEEVRKHHLALVEELFDRYDMYGLELDWMRWSMFFAPGHERRGQKILTEFVREVRRLADEAEKKYGHVIKLAHRVPTDPESCLNFGFDLIEWSKNGWVDMVTLSSFLGNGNFDPQIKIWRAMLKSGTWINTYVESVACPYPGSSVNNYEILFGNAAAALSCGTDGLYLFNENYRLLDKPEVLETMLKKITTAEDLKPLVKRFPVTFLQTLAGDSNRVVLPQTLTPPTIGADLTRMEHNITIRLAAGKTDASSKCFLRLGFSDDTKQDDLDKLEVRINTEILKQCESPVWEPVSLKFTTAYPCLPNDVAHVKTYAVPDGILEETYNAVEILPPEDLPGSVLWAELIVM